METIKPKSVSIFTHDIPEALANGLSKTKITCDTETDGLQYRRDKLRLVSIMDQGKHVYLIRNPDWKSSNLSRVFGCSNEVLFHHAGFDLPVLKWWMNVDFSRYGAGRIKCTKILSKMIKPAESSSMDKVLNRELGLNFTKSKEITKSDWNAEKLSDAQIDYAYNDILYLPKLHETMYMTLLGGKASDRFTIEGMDKENLYLDAMKALVHKVAIEVEGYVDLLQYDHDHSTVALREAWLKHKEEMEKR